MRRLILISTLVLLAAGLASSAVDAQDEKVRIYPLNDGAVYEVQAGQGAYLSYRISDGLRPTMRFAVHTINQTYFLYGVSLFSSQDEARSYFGPLYDSGPVPACPTRTTWSSMWTYDLPPLAPGDHILHSVVWDDYLIPSPCDFNGDGEPDISEKFFFEAELTIRVIE